MSHRMLFASVIVASLAGCGMSEEDFSAEFTDVSCAKMVECFDAAALEFLGFTTEEECVDLYTSDGTDTGTSDDSCDFDSAKAQDCLDAYEAVTCEELTGGTADLSACDDLCKD